jgi:hypothetical protein
MDSRTLSAQLGIDFTPTEWFTATWRDLDPLPAEEPRPFDWDKLVKEYGTYLKTGRFPRPNKKITREEAHFWLLAFGTKFNERPKQISFSPKDVTGHVNLDHYISYFQSRVTSQFPYILKVILQTVTPLEQLLDGFASLTHGDFFAYWGEKIIPYLSREERDYLRELVTRKLKQQGLTFPLPVNGYLMLGCYLGCRDAIEPLVYSIPTGHFNQDSNRYSYAYWAQEMILSGLANPTLAYEQALRVGLSLQTTEHGVAWIANFETNHLDYLYNGIVELEKYTDSEYLTRALGKIHHPMIAPYMLDIVVKAPAARSTALNWLNDNPDLALDSAIDRALKGRGKTADEAFDYLRNLVQNKKFPQTRIMSLPEKLHSRLFASETLMDSGHPQWLIELNNLLEQPPPPPMGFPFDTLLPLIDNETGLPLPRQAFIDLMLRLPYDVELPILARLQQHTTALSRDRIVWDMMGWWKNQGYNFKHFWIFNVFCTLASDAAILELGALIGTWARRRSQTVIMFVDVALNTLAQIPDNRGLLELSHLEQTLSIQTFREKASERLNRAAAEQNLTRSQLEDHLIPTAGLDSKGTAVLDYGSRQFQVVVKSDLTLLLRDPKGKLLKAPPAAIKADDLQKVAAAKATWTTIRTQIKDSVQVQSTRLERLIVEKGRWSWESFETLFLKHPFMRHFCRGILWGAYTHKLTIPFRVTDELTVVDHTDQVISPPPEWSIGIVHPLDLGVEELTTWRQLFQDYELIQPFPQLGREVYTVDPALEDQIRFASFPGEANWASYSTSVFVRLKKQGWDNDSMGRFWRSFPLQNQVACVVTRFGHDHQLILQEVVFGEGQIVAEPPPSKSPQTSRTAPTLKKIKLKNVLPIVFSEALYDVYQVFKPEQPKQP